MKSIGTVVVDIEGTCSPIDAVHRTLFDHALAAYPAWVALHRTHPALDVLRTLAPDDAAVSALLTDWTRRDVKHPALKTVQGLIWHDAFTQGRLQAALFPDVAPALRRWHHAGLQVCVYSSGSALAQRDWFAHTADGDLTTELTAFFDLSVGGKRDPASYQAIAASLHRRPDTIVFLTDVAAELDAARAADWNVLGVQRPGNPAPGPSPHRWVTDFAAVPVHVREEATHVRH